MANYRKINELNNWYRWIAIGFFYFRIKFPKNEQYSSTYAFLFWFAFFSCFTMLYHFRNSASRIRALFNVLLNQTLICLLFKRFNLCLQGLHSLFQKNFVKLKYFCFCGSFCCHLVVSLIRGTVSFPSSCKTNSLLF